jgi:UDP-N-acetylglucosamine 3-dehydrogenase
MLKVGLIGLGVMGKNHLRVLSTTEGIELVAVIDPQDPTLLAEVSVPVYSHIEEINKLKLDYCVVAAPTAFHEEIALSLSNKRIPFLLEKPISFNSKSAKKIIKSVQEYKIKAGIGQIERYNPALQLAKAKISEGLLGSIYQISTKRQGFFPSRISDVGVVLDLATHDIDLTSWVVESRYQRVSANSAFRSGRSHEDLISISGTLESGVIVNHIVNWLSPLKERSIQIIGEKGILAVDTLNSELTYYENGSNFIVDTEKDEFKGVSQGEVVKFEFEKYEPLRAEHESFRDYILNRSHNIVELKSALRTLKVAEAIIKSSEANKVVNL